MPSQKNYAITLFSATIGAGENPGPRSRTGSLLSAATARRFLCLASLLLCGAAALAQSTEPQSARNWKR